MSGARIVEGVLGVKVKVKSKSELVLAPPPPCMHPLLRIHNPGTTRTSRQGKVEIKGVDRQEKIDSTGWGSGVQSGSIVCVCVCVCVLGREIEHAFFSSTQQNEAVLFFSKSSQSLHPPESPTDSQKREPQRGIIWEAKYLGSDS